MRDDFYQRLQPYAQMILPVVCAGILATGIYSVLMSLAPEQPYTPVQSRPRKDPVLRAYQSIQKHGQRAFQSLESLVNNDAQPAHSPDILPLKE